MKLLDAAQHLPEYKDTARVSANDLLGVPIRVSGFEPVTRKDGTPTTVFHVVRLDTGETVHMWTPGFKPEHYLLGALRLYPGETFDVVIYKTPENRFAIEDYDEQIPAHVAVVDQVPF